MHPGDFAFLGEDPELGVLEDQGYWVPLPQGSRRGPLGARLGVRWPLYCPVRAEGGSSEEVGAGTGLEE